jgi:hypothetical protein
VENWRHVRGLGAPIRFNRKIVKHFGIIGYEYFEAESEALSLAEEISELRNPYRALRTILQPEVNAHKPAASGLLATRPVLKTL